MAQPVYKFPDFWTEADLEVLPDDGHRYEICDGSLLVTPPPTDSHQSVGFKLAATLDAAAPKGWRVLPELGVRVPGGNFIPDIAVLYPHGARGVVWREASDVALVVEVASESTEINDKGTKALKYAQAGIPAYWRVARDGVTTVHALMDAAQYGIVATIKPGERWQAEFPFTVVVDPVALIADV